MAQDDRRPGPLARFDDRALESVYRRDARRARLGTTRALIVIGIAVSIAFSLFNPVFFPADRLIAYNLLAVAMIAALCAAWALAGTRHYEERLWLDPAIFAVMSLAAAVLTAAIAGREGLIGIPFEAIAIVNMAVLLSFASIAFVANVGWFVIWAAALMAAYVAFTLGLPAALLPKLYMIANVLIFLAFAFFINWGADRRARDLFVANRALSAEKAKTEELLYNVLPQPVAQRLRAGEAVADSFSDVSVIFVDIVGFSRLAKLLSPGHLVQLLNDFFLLADQVADSHGVEKVKTIGDAYLAVAGGTASRGNGAEAAIAFGCELIEGVAALAATRNVDVKVRVGIHTGPVVGGVVGSSRLAYDYWGDTMNIASRIESAAQPGGIAVSAATWHQAGKRWRFEPPETLLLKGVGETVIHRLSGEAEAAA